MQMLAPTDDVYFLASHFGHRPPPPLGPAEPALHVQSVKAELPATASEFVGHAIHVVSAVALTLVEYFPAPQSTHAPAPTDEEYFPAVHCVHRRSPLGPEKPALHLQSVNAELPAGEMEFSRQGRHSELSPDQYEPASHSIHTSVPHFTSLLSADALMTMAISRAVDPVDSPSEWPPTSAARPSRMKRNKQRCIQITAGQSRLGTPAPNCPTSWARKVTMNAKIFQREFIQRWKLL